MKLILSILALSLSVSCSKFSVTNRKAIKAKTTAASPIDLNAISNPINGFNYYNLPQNAPVMGKQKSADNTPATTIKKKKKIVIIKK